MVNYEQVSYSTDMWSMGVITYMLYVGLSPPCSPGHTVVPTLALLHAGELGCLST